MDCRVLEMWMFSLRFHLILFLEFALILFYITLITTVWFDIIIFGIRLEYV